MKEAGVTERDLGEEELAPATPVELETKPEEEEEDS